MASPARIIGNPLAAPFGKACQDAKARAHAKQEEAAEPPVRSQGAGRRGRGRGEESWWVGIYRRENGPAQPARL
jgi:hypothetical protein